MNLRLRSLALLVALVASLLPGVSPIVAVSAATQPERCTIGDASALFQVSPLPNQVMRPRGQDHPGLLDAYSRCQYRVFRDGETFTFCEGDFFMGGTVAFFDYKAAGISRAAAIAELELATDRVWLDGVEQILQRTAYKDLMSVNLGLIVYQVRGFIIQLPPGDHISTWVGTFPGFPDDTATVTIHILPRELCA
jgi:hypothetical protein